MTTYAVVNTKGGVGKSTNSIHLACHLSIKGPTLLIDGDPQESAATWAAWRRDCNDAKGLPMPVTICLRGKAIYDEGSHLVKNYQNTVVDAGGRDAPGLRNALLLADTAIIPVGASDLDAAAMTDLLEVVDIAKDYNPKLVVKVLLARVDPRTKDTRDMLLWLSENKLNALSARICERVVFRRAIGEGRTVEELAKDPQAIAEMQSFYNEVTL